MSAFVYPPEQYRRRHGPRGYADVDSFRPWLRDEFAFRCVYCLFREQGGRVKAGFTLDHFRPVSLFPDQEWTYENLLYACSACNATKAASVLPDPTQVLVDGAVEVHEDGRIEGKTREAQRLIRVLGLNGKDEREARLLWIGIIELAERSNAQLYQRLMGFPDELPNLGRLRPPEGNTRPKGVAESHFERRQAGAPPATY